MCSLLSWVLCPRSAISGCCKVSIGAKFLNLQNKPCLHRFKLACFPLSKRAGCRLRKVGHFQHFSSLGLSQKSFVILGISLPSSASRQWFSRGSGTFSASYIAQGTKSHLTFATSSNLLSARAGAGCVCARQTCIRSSSLKEAVEHVLLCLQPPQKASFLTIF